MSDHAPAHDDDAAHGTPAVTVDDFHKEFPQIPINERVVRVVQCSISKKKLLRMGRMYLTAVHLCFSGILTTPICVEWEQVRDIQKKSSMLFDSINVFFVDTSVTSLFLTGFINGSDEAYHTMKMLWSVRKRYAGGANAMPPPEEHIAQEPIGETLHLEERPTSPVPAAVTAPVVPLRPLSMEKPPENGGIIEKKLPVAEKKLPSEPEPTTNFLLEPEVIAKGGDGKKEEKTEEPKPPSPQVPVVKPAPDHPPRSTSPTPEDTTRIDPTVAPAHQPTSSESILRTFPSVPKTESIVETFQCSYISGVHRLGKMYVTKNYLLFWSVMMQSPITVKLRDVDSVDKSTSLKILEGLTVTTKNQERFEWTSFVSREKAYQIIHELVTQQQRVDAIGMGEAQGSPNNSKDEEDFAALAPQAASPIALGAAPKVNKKVPNVVCRQQIPFKTVTCNPTVPLGKIGKLNEFDRFQTDWGIALSDLKNFLDSKEIIPEYRFAPGYTVQDIFRFVLDDDTAMAYEYRKYRKDTNVKYEAWRPCTGTPPGCNINSGQRKLVCTTLIRALRETACEFTEYQRFAMVEISGIPHLIIQFSGQVLGVMFSDTFRVESLYIYSQTPDPVTSLPIVSVRSFMYLQYLRFSIAKSKIRSNSTTEVTESAKRYHDLTTEYMRKACPNPASPTIAEGSERLEEGRDPRSIPGSPAKAPMVGFVQATTGPSTPVRPISLPPTVIVQGGEANVAVAGVRAYSLVAWMMRLVLSVAGLLFVVASWRIMTFSPESWLLQRAEEFRGPDSNANLARMLMGMVVESVWPLIHGIVWLLLFVVLYLFHMVRAE